jgi:hypothetical protein
MQNGESGDAVSTNVMRTTCQDLMEKKEVGRDVIDKRRCI